MLTDRDDAAAKARELEKRIALLEHTLSGVTKVRLMII